MNLKMKKTIVYTVQVIEFPKGNGTKALKLKQHDSEVMYAAPNNVSVEMKYRNKSDVAAGVMMHVGGICNLMGRIIMLPQKDVSELQIATSFLLTLTQIKY